MATAPRWLSSLDEIIEAVAACPAPWIDRQLIERFFSVGARRAVTLLHEIGAQRVAGGLVVGREDLVAYLERLRDDPGYSAERRRRSGVAKALCEARMQFRARGVLIGPGELRQEQFQTLDPGIVLRVGVIEIGFTSPEDLLIKLYRLSQFLAENAERLELAITPKN